MKHFRNASFLVLLAVGLFSANAKADWACWEQAAACEQGFGGMHCLNWVIGMHCVDGTLSVATKCKEWSPSGCSDPNAQTYWEGECDLGTCT
jgi:hypothetical protein